MKNFILVCPVTDREADKQNLPFFLAIELVFVKNLPPPFSINVPYAHTHGRDTAKEPLVTVEVETVVIHLQAKEHQ